MKHISSRLSPYARAEDSVRSVMTDLPIALLPAYIWGIYVFGFRALTLGILSVFFSVFFEWSYQRILHKKLTIFDGSAAVTGLLLAMCLPVSIPLWVVPIGAFFAIVLMKLVFGEYAKIYINPALGARGLLFVFFPAAVTRFTEPFAALSPIAIHLPEKELEQVLFAEKAVSEEISASLSDGFLGLIGGGIGEISTLLLFAGFLYLLSRRVVTWHAPIGFLGTLALLAVLFPQGQTVGDALLNAMFTDGTVFAAVFFATDCNTCPMVSKGRVIYGVLCGLFTAIFRLFLPSSEAAKFAVLLLGMGAPFLDHVLVPTPFGKQRKLPDFLQKILSR